MAAARHQIYKLSEQCEGLFESLLIAIYRSNEQYQVVQAHHGRFERWTGYLGVFAANSASLDTRLESSPEIRDVVIRLLEIIERNIQHGICSNQGVESFHQTTHDVF
jgi:hypothetical protein